LYGYITIHVQQNIKFVRVFLFTSRTGNDVKLYMLKEVLMTKVEEDGHNSFANLARRTFPAFLFRNMELLASKFSTEVDKQK